MFLIQGTITWSLSSSQQLPRMTTPADEKKRKLSQDEHPSRSAAGGDSAMTDADKSTNKSSNGKSVALPDPPLDIDDECDVRWRDGNHILRSKIIERRPLNYMQNKRKRKHKHKSKAQMSVKGLKADEIEYYIHYEKKDR